MKWSDGHPLNSTDLEFSLNQYKVNKSDDLAKLIKSAELKKIDELSLSITIPEVNENVNKYLSNLITSPSHAYKKDGANLVDLKMTYSVALIVIVEFRLLQTDCSLSLVKTKTISINKKLQTIKLTSEF